MAGTYSLNGVGDDGDLDADELTGLRVMVGRAARRARRDEPTHELQ